MDIHSTPYNASGCQGNGADPKYNFLFDVTFQQIHIPKGAI
jgi:hypothetical protein